jgi:hypothetical protein
MVGAGSMIIEIVIFSTLFPFCWFGSMWLFRTLAIAGIGLMAQSKVKGQKEELEKKKEEWRKAHGG